MAAPEEHKPYLDRQDFQVELSVALTGEERNILTLYGHWMEALALGTIQPSTAAQERFLLVNRGEAEPETDFERAWAKLKKARTRKRQFDENESQAASSVDSGNISTALSVLRGLLARGRVLSSLADSLLRQAEEGKKLSPKQVACVHRLIQQAEERERNRVPHVSTGHSRKDGSHRWSHPGS